MAAQIHFWGINVKSGESLKVDPGRGLILHLSQASLDESKNSSNESVYLHVSIDDKKFFLGTLSDEKVPHASFDLVFEKSFTLSHTCKKRSVHFTGYLTENPYFNSDSDVADLQANVSVSTSTSAKETLKNAESSANVKSTENSDDDFDDVSIDDKFDDSHSNQDTSNADDDSVDEGKDEDSDDESSEEVKETPPPKKAESNMKRPADFAAKAHVTDKKAKFITPEKTDVKKKYVHEVTPHPSKQLGKAKQLTSKSTVSYLCKICNRTFTTEMGLNSHTKAKHNAAK